MTLPFKIMIILSHTQKEVNNSTEFLNTSYQQIFLQLSAYTLNTPPIACLGGGRSNSPLQPHERLQKYLLKTLPTEISRLLQQPKKTAIKILKNSEKNHTSECQTNILSHITERVTRKIHNKVDIGVDYLSGTATLNKLEFKSFTDYLKSAFDSELIYSDSPQRFGFRLYESKIYSPINKLTVLVSQLSNENIKIAFQIPGKALRILPIQNIFDFITRCIHVFLIKFTRIDIRIDDYKKRIKIKTLHKLAKKGDVAGTQNYIAMYSGVVGDNGKSESDTVYFGSKRCELKVYNAEFVHEIPAYRWEALFRENRASDICAYIAALNDDFCNDINKNAVDLMRYLANKALNVSKFIKRNGDKKQSINRYKQYNFYKSFYRDIGKLDIKKLDEPIKTHQCAEEILMDKVSWLNRQVFKSLSIIKQSIGIDNFTKVYQILESNADLKINKADKVLIEELKVLAHNFGLNRLLELTRYSTLQMSAS